MSTRAEKLTFAKTMVATLEDQVKEMAGVQQLSTDGVFVGVDPNLEKKLEYWRKQVQRYSRGKSRTSKIVLSSAHD